MSRRIEWHRLCCLAAFAPSNTSLLGSLDCDNPKVQLCGDKRHVQSRRLRRLHASWLRIRSTKVFGTHSTSRTRPRLLSWTTRLSAPVRPRTPRFGISSATSFLPQFNDVSGLACLYDTSASMQVEPCVTTDHSPEASTSGSARNGSREISYWIPGLPGTTQLPFAYYFLDSPLRLSPQYEHCRGDSTSHLVVPDRATMSWSRPGETTCPGMGVSRCYKSKVGRRLVVICCRLASGVLVVSEPNLFSSLQSSLVRRGFSVI
jgi:hypothetical protein